MLADDEVIEMVDPAAVAATGDPTAEPLFGLQWDMTQISVPAADAATGPAFTGRMRSTRSTPWADPGSENRAL
jgi:hypothetical protein